ncbi:MAG: hypothetical protein E3K37_08440 [Candidatus Kuenenia sp.]|nr:hypothetical protein [Candidatus Kuenenia hertensis]
MNTLSSDTCPEIARLHVELLRKAPLFQKLQMVTSLVGPLATYPGRASVNTTQIRHWRNA